jgi:hypothetical protein
MTQTVAIPGRRVSSGETFYTDWAGRGGDCVLLRVEVLVKAGSATISFRECLAYEMCAAFLRRRNRWRQRQVIALVTSSDLASTLAAAASFSTTCQKSTDR